MATKSAAQLLKVDEKEFDASIQDMSLKGLLETITALQKEMGREQEHFNDLSTELASLKKNSSQYKSVSKDLAKSQTWLTQLMNRSMKCFAQQGNQQAKATVARKNSFKDSQRSDVKNRNSDDMEVKPVRKADNSTKSVSPAMSQSEETQGQTVSTSYSFSEAMSKFGGKPQNGNFVTSKKTTAVVSSVNLVSQNSTAAESAKQPSGNVKEKVETQGKKEDKVSAKTSVVNVSSKQDVHEKKSSVTSSVSLGPLANQRSQYMSKSVDSLLDSNKLSEAPKAKPDVVKSSNTGKPRSVVVMNADKQVIDLDSFTDRKNMLAELKAGRTELKPAASKGKVDKNGETAIAINKADTSTELEKTGRTVLKANVLGDIRQGKKPSEIKDTTTSANKTNENTALREGLNQEHVQNVRSQFKFEIADYKKEQNTDKASDRFYQNGGRNKAETKVSKTNLPSSEEVTVTENVAVTVAADEKEDSESDDSEASDDDNFVSEFQFPGGKAVFEAPAVKSKGRLFFKHLLCLCISQAHSSRSNASTLNSTVTVTLQI